MDFYWVYAVVPARKGLRLRRYQEPTYVFKNGSNYCDMEGNVVSTGSWGRDLTVFGAHEEKECRRAFVEEYSNVVETFLMRKEALENEMRNRYVNQRDRLSKFITENETFLWD